MNILRPSTSRGQYVARIQLTDKSLSLQINCGSIYCFITRICVWF